MEGWSRSLGLSTIFVFVVTSDLLDDVLLIGTGWKLGWVEPDELYKKKQQQKNNVCTTPVECFTGVWRTSFASKKQRLWGGSFISSCLVLANYH